MYITEISDELDPTNLALNPSAPLRSGSSHDMSCIHHFMTTVHNTVPLKSMRVVVVPYPSVS